MEGSMGKMKTLLFALTIPAAVTLLPPQAGAG